MKQSGTTSASQIPWVHGVKKYVNKVIEVLGIDNSNITPRIAVNRNEAFIYRNNYMNWLNQAFVLGGSLFINSSAQAALNTRFCCGKRSVVGAYATTRAGLCKPTCHASLCRTKEKVPVKAEAVQ